MSLVKILHTGETAFLGVRFGNTDTIKIQKAWAKLERRRKNVTGHLSPVAYHLSPVTCLIYTSGHRDL